MGQRRGAYLLLRRWFNRGWYPSHGAAGTKSLAHCASPHHLRGTSSKCHGTDAPVLEIACYRYGPSCEELIGSNFGRRFIFRNLIAQFVCITPLPCPVCPHHVCSSP